MKTRELTTRQRLVEAAVRRFRRDGFRNVGIEQVYGDVGISKTAFYKHFESKDDLMLAVLTEQTRWLRGIDAGHDPAARRQLGRGPAPRALRSDRADHRK